MGTDAWELHKSLNSPLIEWLKTGSLFLGVCIENTWDCKYRNISNSLERIELNHQYDIGHSCQ